MKKLLLLSTLLLPALALAQTYSIARSKVAGGGGTSTGGGIRVKGIIGQVDAGGTLTRIQHGRGDSRQGHHRPGGCGWYLDRRSLLRLRWFLVALFRANAQRAIAHHHAYRQP